MNPPYISAFSLSLIAGPSSVTACFLPLPRAFRARRRRRSRRRFPFPRAYHLPSPPQSFFYSRFRELHVLLIFERSVKFSVSWCPFSASRHAGKGGSQDSRMEFLHFSALLAETRRARAGAAAARSVSTCGGRGGTRTAGYRWAHFGPSWNNFGSR